MREIKFRADRGAGTDIRWFYYFKIGETVSRAFRSSHEQFTGLHDKTEKRFMKEMYLKTNTSIEERHIGMVLV